MPEADREVYRKINSRLEQILATTLSAFPNGSSLDKCVTLGFNPAGGVRGNRPKDLWCAIFPKGAEAYMPQVYLIVSHRGVELGYAAAIHPRDFSDQAFKAKLKTLAPRIFEALPDPSSDTSQKLSAELAHQGNWYFRRKTRLSPKENDFSALPKLLTFLKSAEGRAWGAATVSRYWLPQELSDDIDLAREFLSAVRLFKPLLVDATQDEMHSERGSRSLDETGEDGTSYWFVGATWDDGDQMPRFIAEGIWENGWEDQFSDLVRRMKSGDRVALKSSFVQKHGLPFDVGGKPVSVMRIKATGTILDNPGDGLKVKISWDPPFEPRDWYFYTFRTTIVEADIEAENGRRLVDFAFRGVPQDYAWWLAKPYWSAKYGVNPDMAPAGLAAVESNDIDQDEIAEIEEEPTYTLDDIIFDGCFLSRQELSDILERWRPKKNLVLQGPPGTGKTWLAKRLGFALIGSNNRETSRSRLRVVQFHPSLAYEDFVRGWRPAGDGRLALVDGIMMQAIEAAGSEPDRPFVLVIEEINQGNPAQIFAKC